MHASLRRVTPCGTGDRAVWTNRLSVDEGAEFNYSYEKHIVWVGFLDQYSTLLYRNRKLYKKLNFCPIWMITCEHIQRHEFINY